MKRSCCAENDQDRADRGNSTLCLALLGWAVFVVFAYYFQFRHIAARVIELLGGKQ